MQGRTVAHYRILRQIGCGGMGVVYQAEDLHLPRLVAIKFLQPDLAGSSSALERFLNEARATCILNHPNIATVYEFDREGDEPFLVMEYLPGGTLRDRMRNLARSGQRCEAGELLAWARQLAAGLAHAHQHHIIHRDVKPANAMFAESGALKLSDFGLAQWRPAGPTNAGVVVGTAAYMSPEQAAGGTVDARSDIYSLGLVLYEMAAGRLPNGKPEPLGTLRPDLPPALAALIHHALERRAKDRCQSAEEMCRELEALDGTARVSAAQTVTLRGVRRPVRRRLAYAVLGVALLAPSVFLAPRAVPWLFYRLPAEKKVALLPFEIPGGDAGTRAFAEGVQDVVAASLVSLRRADFWIVPASELRLQGALDREAARRAFAVNLVAHGRFDGRSRRLHLELLRASDGRALARRTVWLDPNAPAAAQQRVVATVAAMLELPAPLPAAFSPHTDPDAEDLYLQARGFLQRHDGKGSADHAIRQFQLALAKNPQFARAYAGLASGLLRQFQSGRNAEDLKQSEAMALHAASLDPRIAEAFTTLGGVYREQGRYAEAVAELRRALELDGGNPDIYDLLAGAFDAMGQTERAEATYRDAVRLRPSYWVSHAHLGSYYFRRTRYQEALHEYEIVVTLAPDNASNYAYLGGILLAAGRLEDARKALERSLELKPNAAAYSNLGTVYYSQRRYGEAAAMYTRATETGSTDYRIWGNLGDALERTGAAERARSAYQQALVFAERRLQANANDPAVLGSSAVFWAKLRDAERARAFLERALLAAPARPDVLFKAARVQALTGNAAAAVQALRAALQAGYSVQEAGAEPDLAALARNPQYGQLAREFALKGETR